MSFAATYCEVEPTRDEVDQTKGSLILEFGANWCVHCHAITPAVEALLGPHDQIKHIRVADGRGKPLGRSFRVKLWPTFICLRDGHVITELARPTSDELQRAVGALLAG
jgi:thioredoxin 1